MRVDFEKLFKMQQLLDDHINESKRLSGKDILEDKFLALLVEIGEFANEVRCFKYWSNKPMSDKHILLMEFADNVHFLLSIGNYSGFAFIDGVELETKTYTGDLTSLFLDYYNAVNEFMSEPSPTNYIEIWNLLFSIALALDFSTSDVVNSYTEKHEINYQRQASGY